MLSFIVLGRNASILWKSSWIFFRAMDTEHFVEQVSIKAFYLKKTNDGRVSSVFKKMGILSFSVVSLCWNKCLSFLQRKEMLIYLKRCCVHIIYRLLKQKKETKKLRKNNCCWYIATKLVLFFSAVYMYITFTKIYCLL